MQSKLTLRNLLTKPNSGKYNFSVPLDRIRYGPNLKLLLCLGIFSVTIIMNIAKPSLACRRNNGGTKAATRTRFNQVLLFNCIVVLLAKLCWSFLYHFYPFSRVGQRVVKFGMKPVREFQGHWFQSQADHWM